MDNVVSLEEVRAIKEAASLLSQLSRDRAELGTRRYLELNARLAELALADPVLLACVNDLRTQQGFAPYVTQDLRRQIDLVKTSVVMRLGK